MVMMTFILEFDRPARGDKYYIMPGGYSVVTKSGAQLPFDFATTQVKYDPQQPFQLTFIVEEILENDFPEAAKCLEDIFRKQELDYFSEFFVYTGEKGKDPQIHCKQVKDLVVHLSDGTRCVVDDQQMARVNAVLVDSQN